MKLEQLNKANIKKIDNKLFLELPEDIIIALNINELDTLSFTIKQEKIVIWKSSELDIPKVLYEELLGFYKGDEAIIYKWLHTPKSYFDNNSPIEVLKTERGLESILDLINRLKTGDLS